MRDGIVLLIISCFFLAGFALTILGGLFLGFLLVIWYAVCYYDGVDLTGPGMGRWPFYGFTSSPGFITLAILVFVDLIWIFYKL